MKRLRLIGTVMLLLTIVTVINAQERRINDGVLQMIARSEAKHVRSRRNLIKILQAQPQFWAQLQATAARLQTEPAWLLNVMACESLFSPSARNSLPGQTASGLLQFIESTARSMGTTTAAIRRMSPVEQLPLIERYLSTFRGRLKSLADVYLAVFRGVMIEGGDATVISPLDNSRREQRIYALNRWLDLDGDRKITKGELALSALSVGRFQPAVSAPSRRDKRAKPSSADSLTAADPKPTPSTQSIYIRQPRPTP